MKTATLLALIAATVLAGCSKTPRDFSGIPTTDILVAVRCSNPATKFGGTIVCDGHAEQLGGEGHATFKATGHEFVCSFRKTDPDGQISISVPEAGKTLGSSGTSGQNGGVRAEIVRTTIERCDVFTTFD